MTTTIENRRKAYAEGENLASQRTGHPRAYSWGFTGEVIFPAVILALRYLKYGQKHRLLTQTFSSSIADSRRDLVHRKK